MTDLRLSDLTLGSLCRIGIALSTCFWLPASLLLGVAGARGMIGVEGMGAGGGLVGFVGGVLQGLGCSIALDLVLVLGAVAATVAHRVFRTKGIALRVRGRDRAR